MKIKTLTYLYTLWSLILSLAIATIRIFHLFQLSDIVDLELGVLSVMVNDAYIGYVNYSVSSALFPLKIRVLLLLLLSKIDEKYVWCLMESVQICKCSYLYQGIISQNPKRVVNYLKVVHVCFNLLKEDFVKRKGCLIIEQFSSSSKPSDRSDLF